MKTDKISRLISALGQASGYETQQPKVVQQEAGAASTAANSDAVKVALTSQTAQQNEEAASRAKVESIKARYEAGEYKVDTKATAMSVIRDLL